MAGNREVEQRVLAFIAREGVLHVGEKVLLLLSGGADSMAMLQLVRLADRRLRLRLSLTALHVDYGLRGEESTRDRAIVEQACADAQVPLELVRLEGRLRGANFQARARELRYERARALCDDAGCDVVGVAHNLDDQAETILYRLTKYASPLAAAGMRPREGARADLPALARPLLCLGSDEIRGYCAAAGIAYGEDVSNTTAVYARNLLRLEVLPRLVRINPRVAETLAAGAELAAAEREVVDAAVDEAWERVARAAPDGQSALAVDALRAEPRALRLLCLRRLVQEASGPTALVERRVVGRLERLAERVGDAGRVDLSGGWEVVRGGGLLRLRRRVAAHSCAPVELMSGRPTGSSSSVAAGTRWQEREEAAELTMPLQAVTFCGRRYRARLVQGPFGPASAFHPSGPPIQAWLGLARPPERVVLRHPRRGDRFQPLGQAEATTVARFLAAARVARDDRAVALVLEVDGAVVWVGFSREGQRVGRVAHPWRVTESTALTFHVMEEEA